MTPEELQTRPGTPAEARNRRRMAEKYLEVAEEDGAAINVTVGLAALAGIDLPTELRSVVVRNGQGVIASDVQSFVDSVEFDHGHAARLLPAHRSSAVVLDPERQAVRPVVGSVPTGVILEQFNARERIASISGLWDLSPQEIESALRFELTSRPASDQRLCLS